MKISTELDAAAEHLERAVALLQKTAGTAERMPSGLRWIGSITDYKKAVCLLLSLRNLERKCRRMETPKEPRP